MSLSGVELRCTSRHVDLRLSFFVRKVAILEVAQPGTVGLALVNEAFIIGKAPGCKNNCLGYYEVGRIYDGDDKENESTGNTMYCQLRMRLFHSKELLS